MGKPLIGAIACFACLLTVSNNVNAQQNTTVLIRRKAETFINNVRSHPGASVKVGDVIRADMEIMAVNNAGQGNDNLFVYMAIIDEETQEVLADTSGNEPVPRQKLGARHLFGRLGARHLSCLPGT